MGDEVTNRLDTIISILRIAHSDSIAAARSSIRKDKVNAAILDAVSDWTAAGKVKSVVVQKTKQSKPTVERRLAVLVDHGIVERRGSGANVSYRATRVI